MSKRQKSVLKFTMIFPWIIMICIVFSLQMQCENGGEEKTEVPPLTPEETIKLETEYNNYLHNDLFPELKSFLLGDAAKRIKEVLGDKVTLYDPRGNKLTRENIEEFRNNCTGVTDVEFAVIYLNVFAIEDTDEQPDLDDTIIATGHSVFVDRLIKKNEEGKEISNESGTGSDDEPHPKRCVG
jgi:hypothetical protein